jgi:hypothetical protein
MLTQPLVILALLSWVIVLGLDVLGDFDYQSGSSAYSHCPNDKLPPNTKDRVRVADTIDASADHQPALDSPALQSISWGSPDWTPLSFQRAFHIHKRHRVFLI